jgi:[ribosomal protein S5]-alanine N-acetyltransferase
VRINKVIGESIVLRSVEQNDCNEEYISWLNDPRVNEYLETKWENQNLKKLKSFVEEMSKSLDSCLLAIIDRSTDRHIGNIKIGPINRNHQYTDISYFIGETSAWGKGYAGEAVSLVTSYLFNEMKIHSIVASVYSGNIASQKVLEKSGYILRGRFPNQLINVNNEREDHLFFLKLKND